MDREWDAVIDNSGFFPPRKIEAIFEPSRICLQ